MKNKIVIKHYEINEILSKLNFFKNREKKWVIIFYYGISILLIKKILHAEKFKYIQTYNENIINENNIPYNKCGIE